MKNIIFNQVPVIIQKNMRAKNLRLRLDKSGQVLLTLPKWVTQQTGLKFLQDNMQWVHTHRATLSGPKRFRADMTIDLLGQSLTIVHDKNLHRGVFIDNSKLMVSGDSDYIHRRVRDFIKKQAYEYIQQKTLIYAKALGKKPNKITLRDTSSRWGSCSSARNLSFCWKLALAPLYVLDYIIAHESAHMVEMNHSDAFWRVVASIDSNRAQASIWLRKHGNELQAWE